MPLPTGDILGILADNLVKRRSVMPLNRTKSTSWARGLGLRRGGETVIYTGHMYQLMPSIVSMEKILETFEDSWMTVTFGLGRFANKLINLSWFMAWPSAKEQAIFDGYVHSIARLLKAAGVKFGYLYEEEMYAGALIYDEGADDAFIKHAKRVYDMLRDNGVKRLITIDPHTTNVFRKVYPQVVDDFDLEVQSYIEVLAENIPPRLSEIDTDLVIHDSCVYARHEEVVEQPRCLLQEAGAELIEPEFARKQTFCCGGPIESFFPTRTKEIASKRFDQLAECGSNIVTMCPICYVNLRKAAESTEASVRDISWYLAESFLSKSGKSSE
jgi:Fe-S oxidoreductase